MPQIDVRARLIAVVLPDQPTFSPRALADLLDIAYSTVWNAVDRDELPYPRHPSVHRYVFTRDQLRAVQLEALEQTCDS